MKKTKSHIAWVILDKKTREIFDICVNRTQARNVKSDLASTDFIIVKAKLTL